MFQRVEKKKATGRLSVKKHRSAGSTSAEIKCGQLYNITNL